MSLRPRFRGRAFVGFRPSAIDRIGGTVELDSSSGRLEPGAALGVCLLAAMRASRIISAFLGLAFALTGSAHGQDILPATEYVDWSAQARPAEVAPGGRFEVLIDAEIERGWKMYALDSPRPSFAVAFTWEDLPEGISFAGDMRQTPPISAFDPYFETNVTYFQDAAQFAAPFEISSTAEQGEHRIIGTARFMICNADLCLPPTPVKLAATIVVDPNAVVSTERFTDGRGALTTPIDPLNPRDDESSAGDVPFMGATADLDLARSGGVWAFILLAMGAGLAALLTPCVFPMIPLTVSYFTKHSESRSESVRMAGVYGASIIVTFTAIGVLTAIFVGAAGAQTIAANPWINLFIGAVFVIFALSLLGLFDLRLPNGLLNYFNRQSSERSGYLGVLFMGLTLTLVSFSCTAPFVGGLLAATASNEWAYPVAGMVVFSATFSLPFIFFALFPNTLNRLPKSGSWMNTGKVVLGFVELAAALKFLSNADLIWGWGLISRPLAIAISVVIFGMAGFYLIGKLRLRHEPVVESIGVVRLLCAVGFLGLSLYMIPGLFGAPLNALDAYLPPRQATDVSLLATLSTESGDNSLDLPWHDDIESALAQGRVESRPVFIDFTGYTCTNCRQMEANVFPRVADRLRNEFVLLRLYTDAQETGPELQRYQLRLTGTVALPTYAVVDPHSGSMLARRTGMATVEEFSLFLSSGSESFRRDALALR